MPIHMKKFILTLPQSRWEELASAADEIGLDCTKLINYLIEGYLKNRNGAKHGRNKTDS